MDARAHARIVVDRSASCQGFSGDEKISIFNLSTSGCMVSKQTGGWVPGETLLISLLGKVEIAGEIVWGCEPYAGVKFTSELPEQIVALLAFNNHIRRSAGDAIA